MIVTRNSVDLHWSQDGDFSLGPNGDLRKANAEKGRVARQLVAKRLQSAKGDWIFVPELGAGLASFAGLPNTRETGQMIKSAVYSALIDGGILNSRTLDIKVVPTAKHRITVLVYAEIVMSGEPVMINMEYDLRENKLIPRLI
tara:strand:+ start:172 stop:600 length:429 start_codon:yes stop_codon:yes gene_type:complete